MSAAYSLKHCLHKFKLYFRIRPCLFEQARLKSEKRQISYRRLEVHSVKSFWVESKDQIAMRNLIQHCSCTSNGTVRQLNTVEGWLVILDEQFLKLSATFSVKPVFENSNRSFSIIMKFDETVRMFRFHETSIMVRSYSRTIEYGVRNAKRIRTHQRRDPCPYLRGCE